MLQISCWAVAVLDAVSSIALQLWHAGSAIHHLWRGVGGAVGPPPAGKEFPERVCSIHTVEVTKTVAARLQFNANSHCHMEFDTRRRSSGSF